MQCTTRPRITELNPHLLCVLCGGYYIDATAITECLHSFCKSCIVQYLETHKYCPICDVLVHKTKPLQNIRPDNILQSIVYKLIPNLYEDEMCYRRKFYQRLPSQRHPEDTESKGEITESSKFFTVNDTINVSLEYINFLGDQHYFYVASNSKRFFRCQAAVTLKNLQKIIASKYVEAVKHEVRFFYNGFQLPEHLALLDIAYITSWKRIGFIRLLYQILEVRKTVIKVESKETPIITTPLVQKENSSINVSIVKPVEDTPPVISSAPNTSKLQPSNEKDKPKRNADTSTNNSTLSIVETASTSTVETTNRTSTSTSVTSAINVVSSAVTTSTSAIATETLPARENNISAETEENATSEKLLSKPTDVKSNAVTADECETKIAQTNRNDEKPVKAITAQISEKDSDTVKPSVIATNHQSTNETKSSSEMTKSQPNEKNNSCPDLKKKKLEDDCPVPSKIPKIINNLHSIAAASTSNSNHVTEKKMPQLRAITTYTVIPTTSGNAIANKIVQPSLTSSPSMAESNKANSVRNSPSSITQRINLIEHNDTKLHNENRQAKLPAIIKKPTTVKTSKPFSRPWNSAAAVVPNVPSGTAPLPMEQNKVVSDTTKNTTQKPIKFFKARNTPRFLGNPSSGIRPIFQVNSPEPKVETNESDKKKLKNLAVMKIDPKTLCPIVVSTSASSVSASNVSAEKSYSYPSASLVSKLYPGNSITYTSPTSTTNYGTALPSITTASISGKHSVHPFPYQNMSADPLLNSINPLLYGIYPSHFVPTDTSVNGPTSLDFMKAMASFHPALPSSIGTLYNNPHHKTIKHDKVTVKPLATKAGGSAAPAQRMVLTVNSTKVSATDFVKESPRPITSASVYTTSNGLIKTKNKKPSDISSFAINNLIPIEETKNISHYCSADGVNQICDQVAVSQCEKSGISSKDRINTTKTAIYSNSKNELKVTK